MDKIKASNIKFSIYTLGCKTNQSESDTITASLARRGFEQTGFENKSQISIINTCTVTAESDKKVRQIIRRIKQSNPDSKILVTGCFTVFNREFLIKNGIDLIVDNNDKNSIPDLISKIAGETNPETISLNESYRFLVHSRPFIKIQDGCEQNCSYCIVPRVRGRYNSAPSLQIIKEINDYVDLGYEEVVLTGIHIGKYGVDLPDQKINTLQSLMREILNSTSIRRVRLSSIEINEIDKKFLQIINESDSRIARHLHIPLQSGSDKILNLMNRHYSRQFFMENISLIKETIPDVALTTDIIVGFPCETEEDFKETLNAADKAAFSKIHVFKFSPRQNAPASSMNGDPEKKVKSERSQALRKEGNRLRENFINSNVGKALDVIYEKDDKKENISSGTSENYIKIYFPPPPEGTCSSSKNLKRKLLKIGTVSKYKDGLFGFIINS
ncbi:MAG: tRNA (N(6)-L-threonylcarbamoyladenosine(37)-C(2))-methylthiotransferase MtaB [Actinobacteria bacterium]|nr:tRNA (N(6)-L-threonylcarbamoyladenosine(37)-C(2))-methylthiotransferase MtaB [Actinomycetota bacterium]